VKIATFPMARRMLLAGVLAAAVARAAIPDPGDEILIPPTSVPKSRVMTPEYRILMTRSVFSRDHNRARVVPRDLTATTLPAGSDPALSAAAASAAEANFVLKGVAIEDGLPTAFFEQTADQLTVRVRAGQNVSHGQISAITLDGINYQTAAKLSHVVIGQTLDGGLPTGVPTTQPSSDSLKPAAEHPAGDKPSWWRHPK
jgi:hypothetical protein